MPTGVVTHASASRRWRRGLHAGWFTGGSPTSASLGTTVIGSSTKLSRGRRPVRIHLSRRNRLRTIGFTEAMPTISCLRVVHRGRRRVQCNAIVSKTCGAPALVSVLLGRCDLNPTRPIRLAPTWEGASILINASRLGADGRLGQSLFGDLLHRLPLLLERYPSHLLGLLVCGELPIDRRARQVRHVRLAIRELQTLTGGRHGHLPLH